MPLELKSNIENLKRPFSAKQALNLGIKNIPYLIDKLIPWRSLIFVYGSSGTGKSSLLRQMALTIADGSKSFLGFNVNDTGKVVMLSTEDGIEAISMYLNKIKYNIGKPIGDNLVFFDDPDSFLRDLELLSSEDDIKAVFVDCYSDAFDGQNSNDATDSRRFLEKYNRLANKYGYPIIFLHHIAKHADGKAASKNNMIGSQGNQAKSRVAIEIRNDGKQKRTLTITKGNYLSDEDKERCYYLSFRDMFFELETSIIPKVNDDYHEQLEKFVEKCRSKQMSWENISSSARELGFNIATSASGLHKRFGGRY